MPLPKEIKAALETWKKGEGDFPEALDHGVFFPTTGAFDAEVRRKSKGVETAAKEAALAEFLQRSGLTDQAEIDTLKETLEKSGVLKTEGEKTKGLLTKALKDLEDSRKETETVKAANAKLIEGNKVIAKRDALSKFYPRVLSGATNVFTRELMEHLEVSDDGKVTIKGDDKKTLDALVDETLKAMPFLKNPEFKDGAGTKPVVPEDKKTPDLPFQPRKGADGKDVPLTFEQQAINGLVANGYRPPNFGGGTGGP